MPYKIEPRTLTLILDDYEGAEVVCRLNISLGDLLALQSPASSEIGAIRESYERFGRDILISWSIQDESGAPIPADAEGMMMLTPTMAATIMGAWGQQIVAVPQIPPAQ